jgi:hypothetical protein
VTTSRTRAMGLLAVAFAFGLIVGGASIAMAARGGKATWIWRGGRGPSRGNNNVDWGTRLDQRLHLGLAPATRDSVSAIWKRGMTVLDSIQQPIAPALDSIRRQVDSVWQRVAPAVKERRDQTRQEIEALLSPLQKEKYDSMNTADDAQRKEIHDQGARGGPPGMGSRGGPGPRGGFSSGPH